MYFIRPLGLLGLIGIPILIIIYIIKNKYTEQTVSSNYLWHLAEKFLKRKKPISKIQGIISLILQILAVIAISLVIAHPVLVFENSARDYCFVLDASGSMNALIDENNTRFDSAKEKIINEIDDSVDGSTYTVIYASGKPSVVLDRESKRENAINVIKDLKPSDSTLDYKDALKYAQQYYNYNRSTEVYLYTDNNIESANNVIVTNVANDSYNKSVSDLEFKYGVIEVNEEEVPVTNLSCTFTSSKPSDTISFQVLFDENLVYEGNVDTIDGIYEYSESFGNVSFNSITVKIISEDSIEKDNSITVYNMASETQVKVLVISDTPRFLETLNKVLNYATVDIVSTEEYATNPVTSGYGLYIYDNVSPKNMPTDGAVWFFAPPATVSEAGFSYTSEETNSQEVIYNKSTNSTFKKLTSGIVLDKTETTAIYAKEYYTYSLYRKFTVLMTINDLPAVFTGESSNGHKIVVFSFALNNSNLPLRADYVILFRNLIKYSFPSVVEKNNYKAGDTLTINVPSNCKSIKIETPSGRSLYLSISNEYIEYDLLESGKYVITSNISGEDTSINIYSSFDKTESNLATSNESFDLIGEKENNYNDGFYSGLIVIFIILGLVYLADWVVYCYEQYQLR